MIIPITCKDKNLIPEQAISGDAGFDLRANEEAIIEIGESRLIGTGINVELPESTFAMVCSKSGLALKNGIIVLNSPGIVDSGYRGEIQVILKNLGKTNYKVKLYSKVAQLVVLKYVEASFQVSGSLSGTDRGTNGFGSTGT